MPLPVPSLPTLTSGNHVVVFRREGDANIGGRYVNECDNNNNKRGEGQRREEKEGDAYSSLNTANPVLDSSPGRIQQRHEDSDADADADVDAEMHGIKGSTRKD